MGKQLHELMGWPGPMTHRQYRAWREFLNQQWDEPSRADHYLMQIAAAAVNANRKGRRKIKLQDYYIDFETKHKPPLTKEEATRRAKAAWTIRLRGAAKKGQPPTEEQIAIRNDRQDG